MKFAEAQIKEIECVEKNFNINAENVLMWMESLPYHTSYCTRLRILIECKVSKAR